MQITHPPPPPAIIVLVVVWRADRRSPTIHPPIAATIRASKRRAPIREQLRTVPETVFHPFPQQREACGNQFSMGTTALLFVGQSVSARSPLLQPQYPAYKSMCYSGHQVNVRQ